MTKKDRITIIGYGSQGRAWALNLRDSGFDVTVGLRKGSKSIRRVRQDKVRVVSPLIKAVTGADIVVVAIPDHTQEGVFRPGFFEAMKRRPSLVFLHGTSIHFKMITPPPDMPVLLLAPHAPGLAVRDNYVKKEPYSAFYAVYQGRVKEGYDLLMTLAAGIGIPKTHLIKTTFAHEAIGDLFGEQAVLCGGLARLLKNGFETLVEAGLPPQNAYLEVAYQIDLIVDLVKQYGLKGMFDRISPLARYGSAVNGPKVIPDSSKKAMKDVLADIESGRFIHQAERMKVKPTGQQMADLTNIAFDRQAKRFNRD